MPFSAWFALSLLLGAWYAFEIHIARPPMFWMGEPKSMDRMSPFTWTRTLRNRGFMLGYSDLRGNPLWATYALMPAPPDAASPQPPAGFKTDWRGIRKDLAQVMISGSAIERTFIKANLGHTPQSIGLGEDRYQSALRFAYLTRDRFTFLDLAAMMGRRA